MIEYETLLAMYDRAVAECEKAREELGEARANGERLLAALAPFAAYAEVPSIRSGRPGALIEKRSWAGRDGEGDRELRNEDFQRALAVVKEVGAELPSGS